MDINGSRLKLQQFDANNTQIDEFNIDVNHPFRIDGLLDDATWLRADNGLKLYAAIRGHYLYVATQDAGEGSDHFIYVNNVLTTNRTANWAKAGQVAAWSAFLAQEDQNGWNGWFDASGPYQVVASCWLSRPSIISELFEAVSIASSRIS